MNQGETIIDVQYPVIINYKKDNWHHTNQKRKKQDFNTTQSDAYPLLFKGSILICDINE